MRLVRGTLVGTFFAGGLLVAGHAFAFRISSFEGQYTRWGDGEIHYLVDPQGSKDFKKGYDQAGPKVSERDAIRASFNSWMAVPGTKIKIVEDRPEHITSPGNDGRNYISWVEKGWEYLPFAPPPNALAVTITTFRTSDKVIVDADLYFNGEYFTWGVVDSPDEDPQAVDVQNIATHEAGHLLGLEHSSDSYGETISKFYLATMFFASGPGETFRRELKADDMEAAVNLYPKNDPGFPVVHSSSQIEGDAYATYDVGLYISGSNFTPSTTASIVVGGDAGDVAGKVMDGSHSDLTVTFDTSQLTTGEYDVVVTNAFNRTTRIEKALVISSGGFYGNATKTPGADGGCHIRNGSQVPFFITMILVTSRIYLRRWRPKRGNLVPIKSKEVT